MIHVKSFMELIMNCFLLNCTKLYFSFKLFSFQIQKSSDVLPWTWLLLTYTSITSSIHLWTNWLIGSPTALLSTQRAETNIRNLRHSAPWGLRPLKRMRSSRSGTWAHQTRWFWTAIGGNEDFGLVAAVVHILVKQQQSVGLRPHADVSNLQKYTLNYCYYSGWSGHKLVTWSVYRETLWTTSELDSCVQTGFSCSWWLYSVSLQLCSLLLASIT